MWIHKSRWDIQGWEPPPIKERYLPERITFEKPTVVIYNRHTTEWGREPINFFSLEVLEKLFGMLCPIYSVVYVNGKQFEDQERVVPIADFEMIRDRYPNVRILNDLGEDYNLTQLRVFAGCEKFITMNGAGSVLASYFGGENIVYTKQCQELRPNVNSFYNRYPALGGSHIRVVHSEEELVRKVQMAWVEKKPLLNILLRCHDRPNGLARLHKSLLMNEDVNVRVIASYDNNKTFDYLGPYPFEKVSVSPAQERPKPGDREEYRAFFAPNEYLNVLASKVQHGYVLYMDDDDFYIDRALERISKEAEEGKLLLWRVRNRAFTIPSDENFGKIMPGSISSIGFAFHHSMLPHVNWEPWRRGDYRVATKLGELLPHKWLNEVLSEVGKPLDTRSGPRRGRSITPTTEEG